VRDSCEPASAATAWAPDSVLARRQRRQPLRDLRV